MSRSIILHIATGFMVPLLLLFSVFLLFRGHNLPGGGFTGGLTAASAYALFMIARGLPDAKSLLKIEPVYIIAGGLAIAVISAFLPLFVEKEFMQGIWTEFKLPVIGKLGSPLLFDIGVYFLVLGISAKIIFALAGADEE